METQRLRFARDADEQRARLGVVRVDRATFTARFGLDLRAEPLHEIRPIGAP